MNGHLPTEQDFSLLDEPNDEAAGEKL